MPLNTGKMDVATAAATSDCSEVSLSGQSSLEGGDQGKALGSAASAFERVPSIGESGGDGDAVDHAVDPAAIDGDENDCEKEGEQEQEQSSAENEMSVYNRSPKVAKMRYSDHGSHGLIHPLSGLPGGEASSDYVLRRLAYPAQDPPAYSGASLTMERNLLQTVNEKPTSQSTSASASVESGGGSAGGTRVGSACGTSPVRDDRTPIRNASKKRVSPASIVHTSSHDSSLMPSHSPQRRARSQPCETSLTSMHAAAAIPAVPASFPPQPSPTGGLNAGRAPLSTEGAEPLERSCGTSDERAMRPGPSASAPSPPPPAKAGLLHAALQGTMAAVTDSSVTANGDVAAAPAPVKSSSSSPPIIGAENRGSKRGTCLTNPGMPVSNGGLDNSDGNLIVHRNDVLRVRNNDMRVHGGKDGGASSTRNGPSSMRRVRPGSNGMGSSESGGASGGMGDAGGDTDFEVLGLLGQGTFAQVFKCRNVATGQTVAVKIVKNKPAYTRQAAVEIDVFRALSEDPPLSAGQQHRPGLIPAGGADTDEERGSSSEHMVKLLCYFMYHSHLCLVFEMLGSNLYELLKKRQFRGLPIRAVQKLVLQAVEGIKELSQRNVVHCDLKPENILLVDDDSMEVEIRSSEEGCGNATAATHANDRTALGRSTQLSGSFVMNEQRIKLIDFGSACFEGQTAHTYIQSRFYRSPEVLVGLPYDSAIDMWSLGCVAAELFLGLPILPGVHEHDQLGRICEMIGALPDWMLDQGSKATKYFHKYIPETPTNQEQWRTATAKDHGHQIQKDQSFPPSTPPPLTSSPTPPRAVWRMKTRQEFIQSLSEDEKSSRGGLSKLEQQPTNRYFKRKKLADIVMLHGHSYTGEDKNLLELFVHFLIGVLDPDPWKRWTANQAIMHPFLTGSTLHRRRVSGNAATASPRASRRPYDIYWVPPWDPSICRRKLLCVQKAREKQQSMMRGNKSPSKTSASPLSITSKQLRRGEPFSPESSGTSRVTAMTDAMSLRTSLPGISSALRLPNVSPPLSVGDAMMPPPAQNLARASSLGRNYSQQTHLAGSLGITAGLVQPPTPSQFGIAMPGLGQPPQHIAGSYTDIPYPPTVLMSPPIMPGTSGAYGASTPQQFPPFMGPQSFSGVYYDRFSSQHVPVESELGYALQRPGVVPSMGNEVANAMTMQQQLQGNALSYLAQAQPSSIGGVGRASSFTMPSSYGINTGRMPSEGLQHSPNPQYPASSLEHSQMQSQDQFADASYNGDVNRSDAQQDFIGGYHEASTSGSSLPPRNSATSLLAQQLAEHSAVHNSAQSFSDGVPNASANSASQGLPSDTQVQALSQTYMQNQSAMYSSGGPANVGSYHSGYLGYLTSTGAPMMMSAPSNAAPPMIAHPSSLGHYIQSSSGDFGNIYDSVSFQRYPSQLPLHVQGAPPSAPQLPQNLTVNGNGYQSHFSFDENLPQPPPQPPQPSYRGMSM